MREIVQALDESRTLDITYNNERRTVYPLQFGASTANNKVLRAIHENKPKLFYLDEIQLNGLGDYFSPPVDTGTDKGMTLVFYSLNRNATPKSRQESQFEQIFKYADASPATKSLLKNVLSRLRFF